MNSIVKRVEDLTDVDLLKFPVWEYTNSHEGTSETIVRPVRKIPTPDLNGKLVGTEICFANGGKVLALLGNVDSNDSHTTEHLLTLSVYKDGKWFTLARYHDIDFESRGPKALSSFLKIQKKKIFPISYDIREFCSGNPLALSGKIFDEPRVRLGNSEIMNLIFRYT